MSQHMYAIAACLPEHARREAVARAYIPTSVGVPRTLSDSGCPLGICLYALGGKAPELRCPTPDRFADELISLGVGLLEEREALMRDARTFISDWDDGLIEDMAAALGVTP